MNGKVRLKERTYSSKADYTCNDGFDLVGDNYRICQADRSWSGNAPFCECKFLVRGRQILKACMSMKLIFPV